MKDIKEAFLKYWFYVSSAALAILWFWLDRQGRTIEQLRADAARTKLIQELQKLSEKAGESEEAFELARRRYLELKSRHPEYFSSNVIPFPQRGSKAPN